MLKKHFSKVENTRYQEKSHQSEIESLRETLAYFFQTMDYYVNKTEPFPFQTGRQLTPSPSILLRAFSV